MLTGPPCMSLLMFNSCLMEGAEWPSFAWLLQGPCMGQQKLLQSLQVGTVHTLVELPETQLECAFKSLKSIKHHQLHCTLYLAELIASASWCSTWKPTCCMTGLVWLFTDFLEPLCEGHLKCKQAWPEAKTYDLNHAVIEHHKSIASAWAQTS